MPERVYRELRPVVRRQRLMLMMRSMLVGCVAASIVGIYLGLMRMIGREVSPVAASALLVGGPILGLIVGALGGWGWKAAARAVDVHYKLKKATRTLASLSKSHGKRRKIKQILDAEIDSLSECKGECDSQMASRGKKPQKSTSPSNSWGLGTSENVLGDKTNLQSKRDIKEITGIEGDGASEMETTHSPEGRQNAARAYRESSQKYKKMSESVLDTEPIPLGHRQAIRRYFELIRPDGGSSAPAGKTEPAAQN